MLGLELDSASFHAEASHHARREFDSDEYHNRIRRVLEIYAEDERQVKLGHSSKSMSYHAIAARYSGETGVTINAKQVSRILKGEASSDTTGGRPRLLPAPYKKVLVDQLQHGEKQGVHKTPNEVKALIQDMILAKNAAQTWGKPTKITASTGGRAFIKTLGEVVPGDVQLKARSARQVELPKLEASNYKNFYNFKMSEKKQWESIAASLNLGKGVPAGFLPSTSVYFGDETALDPNILAKSYYMQSVKDGKKTYSVPIPGVAHATRHVTSMATFNAAGYHIHHTFIVSGSNNFDIPKIDKCLFIFNDKGSMNEEAFIAYCKEICAYKMTTDPNGEAVLTMDGNAVHKSAEANLLLRNSNITHICLPRYTTHFSQPSDNPTLHGNLKSKLYREIEKNLEIGSHPHLHLRMLHGLNRDVFTYSNIRNALKHAGYTYIEVDGVEYIGIVDNDVSAAAAKLVEKKVLVDNRYVLTPRSGNILTPRQAVLTRKRLHSQFAQSAFSSQMMPLQAWERLHDAFLPSFSAPKRSR